MSKISSKGDSWFFGTSMGSLEEERNTLKEKIAICKERAGIRLDKYPATVESWHKEIKALAHDVIPRIEKKSLPSQASTKSELQYNQELARGVTDQELKRLSRNVSKYTTLWLLNSFVGSGKKVEENILLDIIAKNEKTPHIHPLEQYIEQVKPKSWIRIGVLRTLSWCFSGVIAKIVDVSFQNLLREVRLSTESKLDTIFDTILQHLRTFLQSYRGENALEDFTEKKEVGDLCRELAPFLVKECCPHIPFFRFRILDMTVGALLNGAVRSILRFALPGILENLSETIVTNLTADPNAQYSINYRFANPVMKFINEKLFAFAAELQKPPLETPDPTPPEIAEKLAQVVDEVMHLSVHPSDDKTIQEGIRNGLIDGGYQLFKYWQKEQENILQQVLALAALPFAETQEIYDLETERKEYMNLCKMQNERVNLVSSRLFDLEMKKKITGTPATQVVYHLETFHKKIKRFLEEGLSDIIGLKNVLHKAAESLDNKECRDVDIVFAKHLLFWEGFLDLMQSAARSHYPKKAVNALMDTFYPLCHQASKQVSHIEEMQQQSVLYQRHQELRKLFGSVLYLIDHRKISEMNWDALQKEVNKIEVLLPPNPSEVHVLKKWMEIAPTLQSAHSLVQDLEKAKASIKTKHKGVIYFHEAASILKSMLGKHPLLREDREFVQLYKKYTSLCYAIPRIDGQQVESVLQQEVLKKIEQSIRDQYAIISQLQLSVLYRIHPCTDPSALQVPLSMPALLREMRIWVLKNIHGYETLEEKNRCALRQGISDLQEHVDYLHQTVSKMEPKKLYFPFDSLDRWLKRGPVVGMAVSWYRQRLIDQISGILTGILPLITAKREEGKKNLYSWVERLALYESVKYFKNKAKKIS